MNKLLFILMAAIAIIAMTGCDFDANEALKGNFWARNMETEQFYRVDAEKLAENSRCVVWAEKGSGVTAATAGDIASEYSNNVYVKMINTFGYTVNDPDLGKVNTMEIAHYLATEKTSNAKLTILLLDIKDGYKEEGDPYVGGYFYAFDLLRNDPLYPQYKSNELDMIYLDTYPSVPGDASSNGTLAHEMQHLMNFVSSVIFRFDDETLSLTETWIDEGLSGAAEWVYSGKHPEIRWGYYNQDPSKLIKKGNNFYVWDNRGDESPWANLDDYATVYLLFQYLRLQSGNPSDIYFDIHTSKFSNYNAVITAKNINGSHKDDWPLLLRDWHSANYTNAATGLYGYKDDPTLKNIKAPMVPGGTTVLNLFPGEGVYSRTASAESVPAAKGNVRYAGLSSTGEAPNNTAGFANGARLTYNVDTYTKGSAVEGSTTGIAPPAPPPSANISISAGRNAGIGSQEFPWPFKVDAGYFLKNGNKGAPDEIRNALNGNNGRSINKNKNTFKADRSTVERVFINE